MSLASDLTVQESLFDADERRGRYLLEEARLRAFFSNVEKRYMSDDFAISDFGTSMSATTAFPGASLLKAMAQLLHPTTTDGLSREEKRLAQLAREGSAFFKKFSAAARDREPDLLTGSHQTAPGLSLLEDAEDACNWLQHPIPSQALQLARPQEVHHSRLMYHP